MGDNFLKLYSEPLALALVLEASAYPKPGNVHRLRDREGLRYEAFLATGILSMKYFEKGIKRGYYGERQLKVLIGDLVFGLLRDVIYKLRSTNTCLGSSLILSVMSVSLGKLLRFEDKNIESLREITRSVVEKTTVFDSIYYYKAIRLASPSYIKPSDNTGEYVNVWDENFDSKLLEKGHRLVDILRYSSKFDVVSDEVLNGFQRGFEAEKFLRLRLRSHGDLNRAIVESYLYLLSENKDTIVYIKHGENVSNEISQKARRILGEVMKNNSNWFNYLWEFDNELYNKGINPGAVADLTAETIALFLLRNILEEGVLLDLSY
ncbi:MAG: triphosphoribosyl-dephospho-CoA synthase [Desulfurococcaceae archaeon]